MTEDQEPQTDESTDASGQQHGDGDNVQADTVVQGDQVVQSDGDEPSGDDAPEDDGEPDPGE